MALIEGILPETSKAAYAELLRWHLSLMEWMASDNWQLSGCASHWACLIAALLCNPT